MAAPCVSSRPLVTVDVVIVGAGISGLSAAYQLKNAGLCNVDVLEARNRVGGRTYTVKNSESGYVDLGGAYVGVTQLYLHRMLRHLNLKTYNIDESPKNVYYDFDHNIRCKHDHQDSISIGNMFENLDLNHLFRRLDEIGEQIDVKEPWNSPNAKKLDQMTYGEFVERTCWTHKAKRFARFFINLNVTSEPYEGSLLWFAWYVRQCGGIKRIVSTGGGGQESKIVGGSMQISEELAKRIGQEHVHLNDPVHRVVYNKPLNQLVQLAGLDNQQAVYVERAFAGGMEQKLCFVQTLSGKLYFAQKVILAHPPILHGKLHFDPPLSPMRNQLIQRQPMGSVCKCIVYYKRRFWKDLGLSGSLVMVGDDAEKTPIFFTLDDTKPDGSKPALIGFILSNKIRALLHKTCEERMKLICLSIAKTYQDDEALNAVHYEEHNFMEDQYIGGCYTAFSPPGFLTSYGPWLREPIADSIFLAGTETAHCWSGYLNGAIAAGERAAREALVSLGKLSESQVWLEEPYLDDYPRHDFKPTFYEKYAPSVGCVVKAGVLAAIATTIGLLYCLHKDQCNFNFSLLFTKHW